MKYSSFNKNANDATKEPMFFGQSVNVARYDIQKYNIFEKLIEKQLSFFWRPEEIDVSKDKIDFNKMEEHEKHIFVSNLKYQTLLDSVNGRSPNMAFLPSVSIPELETWIETWSFSETIHSRSYTHIIRNIINDPSEIFDAIVNDPEIIKRAESVTKYYDELIEYQSYYNLLGEGTHTIKSNDGESRVIEINKKELTKKLILSMVSVNVLEAIRFYVSFACSFAFAESKKMEGNAKIIRMIARDEALHLTGTQHIIQLWANGSEGEEIANLIKELKPQITEIFIDAAQEEKEWAAHLFQFGSMIGLNESIVCEYVEYITDQRMMSVGLEPHFNRKNNPIPWIQNWLESDKVQVAPQEVEVSSYLVGQIDSNLEEDEFEGFDL